jgi:hypothetical protein
MLDQFLDLKLATPQSTAAHEKSRPEGGLSITVEAAIQRNRDCATVFNSPSIELMYLAMSFSSASV